MIQIVQSTTLASDILNLAHRIDQYSFILMHGICNHCDNCMLNAQIISILKFFWAFGPIHPNPGKFKPGPIQISKIGPFRKTSSAGHIRILVKNLLNNNFIYHCIVFWSSILSSFLIYTRFRVLHSAAPM